MSLLFTLLHAHRRAPRPAPPSCNISITVHTHASLLLLLLLLLLFSSSSQTTQLPRASSPHLSLSLSLSRMLVLCERGSRSFSPSRPYLFPGGFFFQALLLSRCYPPQHLCVRHSFSPLACALRKFSQFLTVEIPAAEATPAEAAPNAS